MAIVVLFVLVPVDPLEADTEHPRPEGSDAWLCRQWLGSDDPGLRRDAIRMFLARRGERAIPKLLELLRDPATEVRKEAARRLDQLAHWSVTHEAMRGGLACAIANEQDWLVATEMVHALRLIGRGGSDAGDIARALSRALEQAEEPQLQKELILALGDLDAQSAVPLIRKFSKAEDLQVRLTACAAIAKLAGRTDGHLKPLVRRLEVARHDWDLIAVVEIWELFAWVGPAAENPVEEALREAEPEWLSQAAKAVKASGATGKEGVARLRELAEDEGLDKMCRREAIVALGWLRREMDAVVPILLSLYEVSGAELREPVVYSLARLGGERPEVVEVFRKAASAADRDLRIAGLHALLKAETQQMEALEVLLRFSEDPDPTVRAAAVGSLAMPGLPPERVLPILVSKLKDKKDVVKSAAMFALRKIGPPAAEAVPALVPLLRSEKYELVVNAANALEKIGPAASASFWDLERLRGLYGQETPPSDFELTSVRLLVVEAAERALDAIVTD